MYDELYNEIPDISPYLAKIQMEFPDVLDKAYLDELIYRHQIHIPFENLSVCHFKTPVSLEPPVIYEKIIHGNRGGYCFELNNLFYCLLKRLGYHATPCFAKVVEGDEKTYPCLHRGTAVKIDGTLFYCDVGFGGPVPGGAMAFTEGTHQTFHQDTFFFSKIEGNWWQLNRLTKKGDEPMLRIHPNEALPEDFVALNYYCSSQSSPFRHFTDNIILNRRTESGHYSLFNEKLTVSENGNKIVRILSDYKEKEHSIRHLFGLDIPRY